MTDWAEMVNRRDQQIEYVRGQLETLAQYLLREYPRAVEVGDNTEGPVDTAIRLLDRAKKGMAEIHQAVELPGLDSYAPVPPGAKPVYWCGDEHPHDGHDIPISWPCDGRAKDQRPNHAGYCGTPEQHPAHDAPLETPFWCPGGPDGGRNWMSQHYGVTPP